MLRLLTFSGLVADVLRSIQRDWDFMVPDNCIPVQVALQLMDSSTLGKADREPEFLNTYNQIQRTLKSIVNGGLRSFLFLLLWKGMCAKSLL